MEISKKDRLILINQYRILAKLDNEDAEFYNEAIDILENGYAIFYNQIIGGISDEMSEIDGKFVLNILDLYRAIEDLKRTTKDHELINHRYSIFPGFDGNNETEHMSFCRFLIQKQNKFIEQQQYMVKNDNLNSHIPMIDKYTRMLEKSKELNNIWQINVEQALNILSA
ncbi:YfbU family protein [Deefgea piscis]|uniref:YfbU family protein n=1 Tax=Deefgea piscis TaxID=2739061 RepID=UPI001C80C10E|nr:YfbU family protein [Deefgea piscis]QZA81090.1 YfbU family protein [Deefgea piscis]QZA81133.1 YfbU family protein [Deefgea piscis]